VGYLFKVAHYRVRVLSGLGQKSVTQSVQAGIGMSLDLFPYLAYLFFQHVADRVPVQTEGQGRDRLGQTSAKFAPKMEGKNGRNSIPTTGLAKRRTPDLAPQPAPPAPATAHTDPLKKPVQHVLAVFGSNVAAPKSKPQERFVREETKKIE